MMKAAGSYKMAALGWIQERPGVWKCYLVRIDKNRRPQVDQIIWVDGEMPFCTGCLGQELTITQIDNPMAFHCQECGAVSLYDSNDFPEDELDPLDEDEDEDDHFSPGF